MLVVILWMLMYLLAGAGMTVFTNDSHWSVQLLGAVATILLLIYLIYLLKPTQFI